MDATPYPLVNRYALREPEPLALLFSFLDGVPGQTYVSSVSRLRSLGVACGRMSLIPAPHAFHRETLRFPPGESIAPFLCSLPASSPLHSHVFVRDHLKTRLPALLGRIRDERLPRAITHGDIFLDNCLWDESRDVFKWMLDFEEVCYEPAILDVAMTIMGCCFEREGGTLNEEFARAFLEGYSSIRPLTSLECLLLPDMMDFCIIAAAFWRFNQFVVLHPELDMQESYTELSERAEKGNRSFRGWWSLPDTLTWRNNTLEPLAASIHTYHSTRGLPNAEGKSFSETLFAGFAPDGGLYVPSHLPKLTAQEFETHLNGKSYTDVVKFVLACFIPPQELSRASLNDAIDKAFSSFSHRDVVPLVPMKPMSETSRVWIMEMFHGTTGAFKDLSMSIIGQLMQKLLSGETAKDGEKRKQYKTIVVGTSGDTGSAAIHAVRNCPSVDIVVLYPHGRVSKVQELQMVTEPKAHVFAVDGTSDDLDVPIKAVLSDSAFAAQHHLCSINSINLARVAIQSAHFFYAYAQLMQATDFEARIPLVASIPCGACGDLVGALIAREMGLPLKIVAAVNENDIVARTMATGTFQTGSSVFASTSPSMDIQVPYNWERVVYYASGGDVEKVKDFMLAFEADPKRGAAMEDGWWQVLQQFMSARSVQVEQVAQITKQIFDSDAYILDPHTAVGLQAYLKTESEGSVQKIGERPQPVVILSTATPHKFEESVKPTLGLQQLPNTPSVFLGLEEKQKYAKEMKLGQDWESILRREIESISSAREH